jgi:TATA-box binding protein (TBP) (component of TFIID and TFIIIB)
MCIVSGPDIKNLVVLFAVPAETTKKLVLLRRQSEDKKPWLNYFVIKPVGKKPSFTVFPKSGKIVGTGIENHRSIKWTLEVFARAANYSKSEASEWEKKVVNSTYSGKIKCSEKRISTCRVLSKFVEKGTPKDVSVSFRPQHFPGVLLRYKDIVSMQKKGTINLFNNGSYTIVGVTNEAGAKKLYDNLCRIIQTYWTTSSSCVWTKTIKE